MDIEIDLKDERHFTDVAPIVDREDFVNEVERIRNVLKIHIPLSDKELSKIPTKADEKIINSEIEKSRKHLYLPIVFKSVIASVVFRNEVTDRDYSSAYLDSDLHGTFDDEGITPDETHYIVLSPGARDTDVLKAYQDYRDHLGNDKSIASYKYIHRVWETNISKPSLKKYRKWYLARRKGISFQEIATMETDDCPVKRDHKTGKDKPKDCACYEESTIRKGVDTYENLVWKTRTL